MFCSRCNASMPTDAASCPSCGTPVAPFGGSRFQPPPGAAMPRLNPDASAGPGAARPRRPLPITVLALLQFVGGLFTLAVAMLGGIGLLAGDGTEPVVTWIILVALGLIAFVSVLAGVGLWRLRPFGRTMQQVMAGIGLLGVPLGTIVSILILVYLNKPGIKLLFGAKPRETWSDADHAEVAQIDQPSLAFKAIAIVLGSVVVVAVVGVIAAITIPALLRARIGTNESAAIGRIRSIQSAQAVYASESGGAYGSLECLVMPGTCLPGVKATTFVSRDVLMPGEASGYTFEFHPGEPADTAAKPGASLVTFAYVAIPASPGQTGERSFCTDSTGLVCHYRDSAMAPANGVCPARCEPLSSSR